MLFCDVRSFFDVIARHNIASEANYSDNGNRHLKPGVTGTESKEQKVMKAMVAFLRRCTLWYSHRWVE